MISKEDAIAYALSGPNLRGSGIDHDLRRKNPYLDYEKYDFEVPVGNVGDSYDRYLVRMEEMRQSIRILEQVIDKLPTGPINVIDPKQMLPMKTDVLTKMEELIHHFIRVTEGVRRPGGRGLLRCGKSEGRARLFYPLQGRRRAVPPQDSQPKLRQPEHSSQDPARPSRQRRRDHPGIV